MSIVILVNERDEPRGFMEKMEAHELGELHRAFSVFITNRQGEMLLQRRAAAKYHSPQLWTNACCSHPGPNETVFEAAHRRMPEELGFDCDLQKLFDFVYQASFANGLREHEFDHVLAGQYDGPIHPDPNEVAEVAFMAPDVIKRQLIETPYRFTPWFRIAFDRVCECLQLI